MPLIAPLAWAPHCCLQLYLGVKQRSCETPVVFVRFPIIITILPLESMAAHRTPGSKVMKFGTLIQDSPISPHSKYEVASLWTLAPPIGQSWTCIHVNNFWPIHPMLTDKASLESLGQAEFNAPYDVILRQDRFSAILVYVQNALIYRNKIWWHASRLFPKCRKKIWCHLVPRGAIINKIAFLLISLFIQKSPF